MPYRRSLWSPISVAIVLGLLLPGCAGAPTLNPEDEPVTITFACMDYQRSRYEDLAQDFQKANPGIIVQFISADEASGIRVQGSTISSSGNEIEGLAAAADTFVWWVKLDPADWPYLLNLQPFVDDDSFPVDDFYPATLGDLRWQGDLHGLPAEVMPVLIFHDKGLFDEAGVSYPEAGWTWDDFLDAADQLTKREGDEVTRYGFVDSHFHYTILAQMHQHGISLWNNAADPPEPLFDRPEVASVLHSYIDLALTYEVMPIPEVGSNVMASNLVDEGKAAMWTDFAFDYSYHANRVDLGVVPFPEDVAAANPRFMSGFFASAGTAYPEAAWRWLTYLSEHYQPLDGYLPGRRSVGQQMRWWRSLDGETKAVFEYALDHPTPAQNPLNQPLQTAISSVIKGEADVEEALATAQARALELQAELALATPAAAQPVAPPQSTPTGAEIMIKFAVGAGADMPLYRELAATFHESHPGVRVEVVAAPYDLWAPVEVSDCFVSMASLAGYPGVRQYIRSLDPLMEAGKDLELDDFYSQFLEPVQRGGELWGIPYEADALMVYYNRDRFAQAGVAPPEPGWSFDDFLSTAAVLSRDGQYGFATCEGAYGDLVFVLERMGAHLFDSSGEPPVPTFDDPTVVAALARYADAARQHPLTPATSSKKSGWPDSIVRGDHPDGVRSGRVAMWIDYISDYIFAPPLPFEVGVAPLPAPSGAEGPIGARATTEFSVRAYYISARTAEPQACWEWLAFLSGRPDGVHLLPARLSAAASPKWREGVGEEPLPAYLATLEYEDTSILRLRWEHAWLAYTYPWLDEAFQATVTGEDAGRALAEAQRKVTAYLDCVEQAEGFEDRGVMGDCARDVDPGYPLSGE